MALNFVPVEIYGLSIKKLSQEQRKTLENVTKINQPDECVTESKKYKTQLDRKVFLGYCLAKGAVKHRNIEYCRKHSKKIAIATCIGYSSGALNLRDTCKKNYPDTASSDYKLCKRRFKRKAHGFKIMGAGEYNDYIF